MWAFRVLNPRQWSLAKQSSSKSWKLLPQKCRHKLEPKGMVWETHKTTISINFNTENVDALNATDQPKSIVELGYMCPRGLSGPLAVTLTK